mgnify:CR=1 FL=1
MKLQLLIAIGHQDYMEHLSDVLTQRYGETFEVSVCSTGERLRELLSRRRFDAALLDETLAEEADLSAVRLPLLLWDGTAALGDPIDWDAASRREAAQVPADLRHDRAGAGTLCRRVRQPRRV